MNQCETCVYYVYDEEYDEYICEAEMDEDDWARLMEDRADRTCPFWRNGDEYAVVRHQM